MACWGKREGLADTPPPDTFVRVDSAPRSTECGVRTDGTIACWGNLTDVSLPPDGFWERKKA